MVYFLIVLLTANLSPAQATNDTANNGITSKKLTYTDAALLGLVEGFTEYLPVSSTGHLILTNSFLGLDGNTPVRDHKGELILIKESAHLPARPYTVREAAFAYAIVIQAGAIAAVITLYWKTILQITLGCFGKNPIGRKLAINLICAFLPAAVIGLLLEDLIEVKLGDNINAVAGALIIGALVMFLVERWRKKGREVIVKSVKRPNLHSLTLRQALMIGLFQCIAMWPGASRSMVTIVGGYIAGLSPKHAAEFSFLLGLITLSAASGYKILKDGDQMINTLEIRPMLVGFLFAFVSAACAVKWFVNYLNKNGLVPFAWYRIGLAIAVFLLLGK